ncbi:DUF305 domain-containing protein [Microbacterium sp. MEC084]|uniref:DUF305 domain-containing protein n=1 Tax=Microbacterium sp. MEC084 TaxID=1963027 RepID=UPI00106FBB37|nr:DUF305 domain-containing protein [Microbacterium sp. MEC084]MCD1268849.1 DUF305 domain-containing protein [Microbacterium sp. MEC084]
MKIRTLTLGAGLLAAALTLAGCTGTGTTGHSGGHSASPATPAASAATFDDADVAFATGMIAHHQQAVDMSDLLLAKDGVDPEVAALAERIKAAQGPEIETMEQWLAPWGHDAGHGGMDHGDGMMSEDDMAALEEAAGAEASTLFLEQMIVHHEGAIAMSETQLADGENPDALALAERIIADQTAEIAEMRGMLDAR